jgi:hypothetical protein
VRTVLLVIKPDRYAQLQTEISAWAFDRGVEGWTVRIYQTTQSSGYGLRAELAVEYAKSAFDHVFFVGNTPTIWVMLNLDGHGFHLMPARSYLVNSNVAIDNARQPGTDTCNLSSMGAFSRPYAHIGQLNFDGMAGFTDDEITDQYRQWFARRHDISVNGFAAFPVTSFLDNHFGLSFGPACVQQFAKFPKSMNLYLPDVGADGYDGQRALQLSALTFGIFTGGENYGDGQYLWYYGKRDEQILTPCQAAIWHCYGSHMGETYSAGSYINAALVNRPGAGYERCKAIASVYNHAGGFAFHVLLDGGTGGQAASETEATTGWPADYWNSDPTVTIDAATLARLAANETEAEVTPSDVQAMLAPLQQQITDLKAQIAPLLASGAGGGTTDTGGAVVIVSAIYRQRDNHALSVDNTAEVAALVAKGIPWDPGDDLKDPFKGVVKEEVIVYTKGGVQKPALLLTQWQKCDASSF